jgi:hypothetical protein
MSKLYICGSFRFSSELSKAEKAFLEAGISCNRSQHNDPEGIRGCLNRIDGSENVYVVNPDGYIGRSVALDIGYAYAKRKTIYSMVPISDPPIDFMIEKVVGIDELSVEFVGSK